MKNLFLSLFMLSSTIVFAQEIEQDIETIDSLELPSIKRIAIGVKFGVPNIAGLSLEGVTPLLGNRIAPFFDYSSFNVNPDEVEVGLTYTEFGSNIYFGNKGKGVYAGIGFGSLDTDLVFTNIELTDDNGNSGNGTASISQSLNTTNIKLGIKTGGRFYFRLEVGYGIGDIPDTIDVTGDFTYTENGQTIKGSGTQTEEFPTIPGVGTSGVLIGNFGFGIAF
ncbi:MAG: hypothetical protein QNL41_06270 [Flavobacteriaceae bacterium]